MLVNDYIKNDGTFISMEAKKEKEIAKSGEIRVVFFVIDLTRTPSGINLGDPSWVKQSGENDPKFG